MSDGSAKRLAGKRTTGAETLATNTLARFLEQPERPPGTLPYHELQGFLFAVATSPELVRPSEWMPIVFGGQEVEYADLEEARTMLAALMGLYNDDHGGGLGAAAAGHHHQPDQGWTTSTRGLQRRVAQ